MGLFTFVEVFSRKHRGGDFSRKIEIVIKKRSAAKNSGNPARIYLESPTGRVYNQIIRNILKRDLL